MRRNALREILGAVRFKRALPGSAKDLAAGSFRLPADGSENPSLPRE